MKQRRSMLVGMILAVIAIVVAVFLGRNINRNQTEKEIDAKTLYLWYSDDGLTDYLKSVALSYQDEKGIKVVPVYHTEFEYLEAINEASLSGNEIPDLYIAGTNSIEKAVMSGLAIPVSDTRNVLSNLYFPEAALNSVSYQEQYFAYPFYFETAFLLCNKTYLKQFAAEEIKKELQNQLSVSSNSEEDDGMEDIMIDEDPLSLPEGVSQENWDAAIEERIHYYVPETVMDITSIANTHASPAGVESFFCWDVSDIYYNYFFTGACMNIGGANGDNRSVIDICNEDSIHCMGVYSELNQFFSIDSENSRYEDVIEHFLNGEYIYTIATSDVIKQLGDNKSKYEFLVAPLPGVDMNHPGRGLSYTKAVMINGHTDKRTEANDFAAYLTYNSSGSLYDRTGKISSCNNENYETEELGVIRKIYADSISLPKIVEMSNFWLKLEQAYTLVWNGDDPEEVLSKLSEDMKSQLW